jgi:hypothetical protein
LNEGEKIYDGNPAEAIQLFMQLHGAKRAESIRTMEVNEAKFAEDVVIRPMKLDMPVNIAKPNNWPAIEFFQNKSILGLQGKGKVELLRLAVLDDEGQPTLVFKQGDRMNIYCEFLLKKDIETPLVNVELRDKLNLLIHAKNAIQNRALLPSKAKRGDIVFYSQNIVLNIAPKRYVVNLYSIVLSSQANNQLVWKGPDDVKNRSKHLWRLDRAFAITVLPRYGEDIEILHGGLCDLPGESTLRIVSKGIRKKVKNRT